MQIANICSRLDLPSWLSSLEERYPESSGLGLVSAWQDLISQNKCPLSVEFTKQRFRELEGNFGDKLTVLFGRPISHSLSPALHNFFNLGMSNKFSLYLPTQIESESSFIRILRHWQELPLVGANVTSPFKECAFRYLLEHGQLSQEARIIGAVNTIWSSGGQIYGDNTDWCGWLASWRHYMGEELTGRDTVIFGAGGAARAVVYALIRSKVKSITIVNSPRRGQELTTYFSSWQQSRNYNQAFIPIQRCSTWSEYGKPGCVYIQATVLGSSAFPNLTPYDWADSSSTLSQKYTCNCNNEMHNSETVTPPLACDLIYNPSQTEFLRLAQKSGSKTMNGLGMLICQAYRARARFFNLTPSEIEEEHLVNSFSSVYSQSIS